MKNFELPNYIIESLSHGKLHLLILDVLNNAEFDNYSLFGKLDRNKLLPYIKAYIADLIIRDIFTKAVNMSILNENEFDDYDNEYLDSDDFVDDAYDLDDYEDELDDYDGDIVYMDELDDDDEINMLSSDSIVREVYNAYLTNINKIECAIGDFENELLAAEPSDEDIQVQFILNSLKIYNMQNMRTTEEYFKLSKSNKFILHMIDENSILKKYNDKEKEKLLELVKCVIAYQQLLSTNSDTYDEEITSNYMESVIFEAMDIYSSQNDTLHDLIYNRDCSRKYIRSLRRIIKDNGFDK